MNREYIDILARELARHGVSRWHVDRSHRHPRLQFEWQGRSMFYVIPASSSDRYRGAMKARADLRRMLRG
jgi:hypothetical protein